MSATDRVGDVVCGWWVGPVWKDGGEICRCVLDPEHAGWHECSCGAQFQGCGRAPGESHPCEMGGFDGEDADG